MSLSHALLAALLEGDASGYELAKRFDVSVANFWSATPPQLYRELDRLVDAGMLDARVVEQQRRPNKRVYAITDDGRDELVRFSAAPTRPSAIRDELLVKLLACDVGDVPAVIAAMEERVEQATAKLVLFDRLRERMLDGRTEDEFLATADRVGSYLTLMRGRSFERENIAFGERVVEILGARVRARA